MGSQATRPRRRCWSRNRSERRRNVLEPSWVSFEHRQNRPARREIHNPEDAWRVCPQFPEYVGTDEREDIYSGNSVKEKNLRGFGLMECEMHAPCKRWSRRERILAGFCRRWCRYCRKIWAAVSEASGSRKPLLRCLLCMSSQIIIINYGKICN